MAKFGINTKAVEGRERKKAAADEKERQKQTAKEAKEAEEWKKGTKSCDKKAEEEAKRLEKLAKKREREALEAEEARKLPSFKTVREPSPAGSGKKTQHELLMARPSPLSKPADSRSALLSLPTEPLNRPGSVLSSGSSSRLKETDTLTEYSASNLEDAVSLLDLACTTALPLEKHPERRVKAAYALFEQNELPILKQENPELRLSQLRELLRKKWAKAPENPFNQASISYRATREEEQAAAKTINESQLNRYRN